MADSLRHPDLAPPHPGELLREVVLPSIDISVSEMADRLHVTRQTLHRILSEESAVSPEMALRLGKLCGNGPNIWLGMQKAYDLWRAARELKDELAAIETIAA